MHGPKLFASCYNEYLYFFKEIKRNLISHGSDIYFIGGFGTVAWVDVKEYETLQPDKIAVDGGEQNLKVYLMHYQCKKCNWIVTSL